MSLRYLDSDEPLNRFLELKAEEKRIQEEIDELKPLITAALMEEPEEKCIHMGCELSIMRRTTYEYSDQVEQMRTNLKAAEKYEQSTGIAGIKKQSAYPVVKAVKQEPTTF